MQQFKVDYQTLRNLLRKALVFADKKKSNAVVFVVSNGELTIFAKNDVSGFKGSASLVESDEIVDVSFAINGEDLFSIIDKSDCTAIFKVSTNYVSLICGHISARLSMLNYEIEDNFVFNPIASIDFEHLAKTASLVSKCAGKDEQFNGILLKSRPNSLIVVATDGRRLAEYFLPFKGDISVVLEYSELLLCKGLFSGPVELGVVGNTFFIKDNKSVWRTLIKNIDFIDYSFLIISEFKNDFFYGEDLINAAKKVALLSEYSKLTFENHKIIVSATAKETDVEIHVPVSLELDKAICAYFNSKYLIDAIADHGQLKFNDASSGFYFCNGDNKQILMPRMGD